MKQSKTTTDFSTGSIPKLIIALAIPNTIAQVVNLLYNIVDRIFIGHISQNATLALSGIGLCFPIISMISAFTQLAAAGGAPLFSIARGCKDEKEAEMILGNCTSMLLFFGVILSVLVMIFQKPLLLLLGASTQTLPYAMDYLTIYLFGTMFMMISLGLNSFINAQGFAKIGLMRTVIGAVTNLILDPIFIFMLDMGVKGAALATVISQIVSALWTLSFLIGQKTEIKLTLCAMKQLKLGRLGKICSVGMAGFIIASTTSITQSACNAALLQHGGDIYVTVMTIVNSIRDLITMPLNGISQSAQPVISYNYGSGQYNRVCRAIRFTFIVLLIYSLLSWAWVMLTPQFFIKIFNNDPQLIEIGTRALNIYFFGFCFMGLQMIGQAVFGALGKAKLGIFFAIFRKIIIVLPLIYILPDMFRLGTDGIFLTEPISNVISGLTCILTMYFSIYQPLRRQAKEETIE